MMSIWWMISKNRISQLLMHCAAVGKSFANPDSLSSCAIPLLKPPCFFRDGESSSRQAKTSWYNQETYFKRHTFASWNVDPANTKSLSSVSQSMDPTYPLAPIANFLGCILVLLPLFCTSIRSGSWNIAVISFTLWIAIECVTTGVNAIVWSDNVRNVAPVWCDLSECCISDNG